MRKNKKQGLISYENSIFKSNEISMAKMNQGLTLNQMQLLAFTIYSTQKNGATEFCKADFEKKFGIEKYQTVHAKQDVKRLRLLGFTIEEGENLIDEINVFQRLRYDNGTFMFKWAEDMIPHILELKNKYISIDLTITSQFKSSFSWILYDYLKAHYGYWHKPISKELLMCLFGVQDKKTYQKNTSDFKKTVLDVAIEEINVLTELEVRYKEIKEGRAIVGFDLIWSNGKTQASATKKQITELGTVLEAIFDDVYIYMDLKDEDNRQRAIEIIRKLEETRIFTVEPEPICITKERADFLIQQANSYLRELEQFLEINQNPEKRVGFYNWLEERE